MMCETLERAPFSLAAIANGVRFCLCVPVYVLSFLFRAVMEVPTDKPFSEDQARFYFQDRSAQGN